MDREVGGLRLQVTLPRLLLVVGLLLLVAGLALAGRLIWMQYQLAVERSQVSAYTTDVGPLAGSAGALVTETIGPELSAYAQGQVSSATLAQASVGWQADFLATRRRFQAIAHDGVLKPIASGFDKALLEYAQAVQMFGEVALLPGDKGAGLAAAEKAAQRADSDYAAAARRLACLRQSLGLPQDPRFKLTGGC